MPNISKSGFQVDLQNALNYDVKVKYEWDEETNDEGHWIKTENNDNPDDPDILVIKTSGDLIFDSKFNLTWKNRIVLKFEVGKNIVFEKDAKICYNGETGGGLILCAVKGTIKFPQSSGNEGSPPLDFNDKESSGAVSVFYNPEPKNVEGNKYDNPTDFKGLIQKNENVFFRAFMLVHNPLEEFVDLNSMMEQKSGEYALYYWFSNSKLETAEDLQSGMKNFTGSLNLNYKGFGGLGFDFDSYHNKMENFIFENCSIPLWGPNFLFASPPLYGHPKQLFDFSNKVWSKEWSKERRSYFDARTLVCVNGADLKTPLHHAAEKGNCKAIEKIWNITWEVLSCYSYVDGEKVWKYLSRNFIDRPDAQGRTALKLAIQCKNLDAIKCLLELYRGAKWPLDYESLAILTDRPNDKEINECLKELILPPDLKSQHWKAFPKSDDPCKYEYACSRKAHERFFVKDKSGLLVRFIAKDKNKSEIFQVKLEEVKPDHSGSDLTYDINLNGIPARSRIIIMQNIHKIMTNRTAITYLFAGLQHEMTKNSTENQPGNMYYAQIGAYDKGKPDDIRKKMKEISERISSQKIAEITRTSRISGNPITSSDLLIGGHTGNNVTEDASYLNRFMISWDFEVVRRLHRENGKTELEFDKLPIGVGIARITQFVSATDGATFDKYLTKPEQNAESVFHPFSGVTVEERKRALQHIYQDTEPLAHETRKKERLPEGISIEDWEKRFPSYKLVATTEQFHQELLREYGGGYESSGEAYSDDE